MPSVEEEAVARLDLKAVAPGGYEVVAEWLRGGKVVATGSLPFHRERTPTWSEAKALGRSDQVLPPWQPVRLKAAELACWNRVYRLKPDGFPAQIESAGEPLLAAPVALHVRANGAELAWQTQPWKGTVGAATVTGSASQRSGALALRCAARLEYDGFLLYEVRLAA